ncbi:MAG: hypothetical protein Q7T46_10010 [Polaromonas sp.]|nr:hypothetical protein [Polaromonas sp.]
MNAQALFDLLQAAYAECGHRDYVVIGSLSVLGMSEVSPIPSGMTVSIDADCYTLSDPPRVFDLRWVRAGVKAGLVSLPVLRLRMRSTDFLDAQEQAAALQALDRLVRRRA